MVRANYRFMTAILTASLVFSSTVLPANSAEAAKKLSISKKSITLKKGNSATLKIKNLKKSRKVTWKSSKPSVANVTKKGKITAKKTGTAVITAQTGKQTFKCKVTVIKKKTSPKSSSSSTTQNISSNNTNNNNVTNISDSSNSNNSNTSNNTKVVNNNNTFDNSEDTNNSNTSDSSKDTDNNNTLPDSVNSGDSSVNQNQGAASLTPIHPFIPSIPSTPSTPEEPLELVNPSDAEKPSKPEEPSEPEKPSEPEEPSVPEKPSDPVVDTVEPMEEVTNVTVMTTGQIIVQFSAEIEKGSVHDVSGNLTGVSLKAMAGAAETGSLDAYLTDDCTQLYIVPETAPNGKYKLKIEGLTAQNGHTVKDYEDTIVINNENEVVSSIDVNLVSISRISVTTVMAIFDKTIINPGTLTVSDSKITKTEVQGKVGPDPSTVLYTLTPEMQELLKGVVLVSLSGYVASGDNSEEEEENKWDVYMSFDYVDESKKEPLDTSDQPLPPPSNVTQATDTNSMIYVVFQNRVDSESAENAANYTFNDGPVITDAEIVKNSDKGALIALTVQECTIPEMKEYELTISNVKGYNNTYLPMEAYSISVKLNDNTPAYYTGSEFVRGGEKSDYAYQIILEFSENIDFGSVAKYFNLEASWVGKDEKGNTVPLTSSITMYEASATGADNKITIGFDIEGELPVGAKINVAPINQGENSGTYLVDEGGNIVKFTSAEVQVSY